MNADRRIFYIKTNDLLHKPNLSRKNIDLAPARSSSGPEISLFISPFAKRLKTQIRWFVDRTACPALTVQTRESGNRIFYPLRLQALRTGRPPSQPEFGRSDQAGPYRSSPAAVVWPMRDGASRTQACRPLAAGCLGERAWRAECPRAVEQRRADTGAARAGRRRNSMQG